MNITFHQLRVFTVIVEKRSITKASEALNMTQPAVSIQLRNLQEQFDRALTEVIKRRIYITDFGMELYRIAEKVLTDMDSIQYRVDGLKGDLSGKLKVSAVSTGKYVLPHFLSGFLKAHPGVELKMDVTNRSKVIKSLQDNEVDFSLVSVLPQQVDLMEEILMPNKWYLVSPRSNADMVLSKPGIVSAPARSVFKNIPLIFREEGSGPRYIMQQYFRKANITPKISLELASDEAVKQAVMAGLGFSILSILSIRNELKQKQVKIIPIKGLPLTSSWRMIWLKKKNLSPVALAYLEYIRREKEAIYKSRFSWIEGY